jgi:hypothetical protein
MQVVQASRAAQSNLMTRTEIEAWALRVIDSVKAGAPNEDSRVELKREWIEPKKAARRLAAHANAAGANRFSG